MAERGSRKIPVTDRQFLWVQDDDKGEVILHVGPTMVSPTAADRVVIDDGMGAFREDISGRPQQMVELSDAQYAVLQNPLAQFHDAEEGPNGRFKPGRNESRELRNGTRDMIPGPCSFYLRPGQRVEVRDAHELASNQYLVVKVYGEVDAKAPYYEITAKSAAITTATAEDTSEAGASTGVDKLEPVKLTRGQLIVIRGLDTQFYIPPTGVDVVPDLTVDEQGTQLTAAAARKILATMGADADGAMAPSPASGPVPIQAQMPAEEVDDLLDALKEEPEEDEEPQQRRGGRRRKKDKRQGRLVGVEQAARVRHQVQRQAIAPPEVVEEAPQLSHEEIEIFQSSEVHRQALEREVRKGRLVRQAVVLSEKEFCVILDADGKRQIKRGPARVFPGPYDSFQTMGSSDRIYYAYELLPQRALWLRFISEISKANLSKVLPRGVDLDLETYHPGDELILTGVNSFFFPFNEIEILHPMTGQPHVGNNHSDLFIEAIGIDQKSGIYVRDLTTGEVRLVRGKLSYLVDPRKEVHITRTIPTDDWNLWVAVGEPHKQTPAPVKTPWALSIIVPHNTAILSTSADGQRVIQGPCVELLHYEETLTPMELSTGTPKSDDVTMRTCFLRTVGNRVSDVITMETADFVTINVKVSYQVTFDKEHRDRWFNVVNYVGVLCEHLRSLVRGRARQLPLVELWPNIPAVVRDIILGERTEKGREGRLFEENGMRVTEVEVLSSEILDEQIADLLENVQRDSVSMVIGDRQASEQLRSDKLRHDIELDRMKIRSVGHEQQAQLDDLVRRLEQEARIGGVRDREAAAREESELTAKRKELEQKSELERSHLSSTAGAERRRVEASGQAGANKVIHEEDLDHQTSLAAIERSLIDARSQATVAERQAVQPALVESLTALGDKVVLGEVANNMNLVSLFKGKDIATIFAEVVGGTKLKRTIGTILPKNGKDDGVSEGSSES